MQAVSVPSNVIWLKVVGGHWHAEIWMDETVYDMFGTNILPTPFSSQTPAEVVFEHIQGRNPEMVVLVIA